MAREVGQIIARGDRRCTNHCPRYALCKTVENPRHGQLGFVSHHMFQARLGDGAQRAVVQKWVPLASCQPLFSAP